jgi:hypothetical protein
MPHLVHPDRLADFSQICGFIKAPHYQRILPNMSFHSLFVARMRYSGP